MISYFDLMGKTNHSLLHPGGMESTQTLLKLCGLREGMKILEVGCGSGFTSCWIAANHQCQVYGIDKNENMIASAMQRAEDMSFKGEVNFRVGTGDQLPFEDCSFDLVFCEGSTSFFENKNRVASEYFRVLKPAGRLGEIEFYYKKKPSKNMIAKLRRATKSSVDPFRFKDWQNLYASAGFELNHVVDFEYGSAGAHNIKAYVQEVGKELLNREPLITQRNLKTSLKKLEATQQLFDLNRRHLNYAIWAFSRQN